MSCLTTILLLVFWLTINIPILDCSNKCIPITQRNGIDVYEWSDIEYGVCSIQLTVPFIIINSQISKWGKLTKNKIIKIFKSQKKSVTLQYKTSDCSCFDDDNISLCHDFVYQFSSYSSEMEQVFGNRINSIWYQYEINHKQDIKYLECIKSKIFTLSIKKAIKKSKSLHNDTKTLSAVSYPIGFKFNENEREYYTQYIEYKYIKPYFKIFKMKNKLNDIAMMNSWIGSTGYQSKLHFDKSNNIYFMLSGNKTFYLSPPGFNNNFTIFPFLHVNTLNVFRYNLDNNNNDIKYKVNINKNEIFYLPAYWYHHVINGKYNSFALNIWIENYDTKKIQHYQFPKEIRKIFANSINSWPEILYFIQKLQFKYFNHTNYDSFLFKKYFNKIYPILNDIKRYNLIIGDNKYIINNNNLNWMFWFIDFKNMLKCYRDKDHLLKLKTIFERDKTIKCYASFEEIDEYDNKWNNVINELLFILRNIQKFQGDGVAQIELADFIEKILFLIAEDTIFFPLIVSLYFL